MSHAQEITSDFTQTARTLIKAEGEAVLNLHQRIGMPFERACELIFQCQGKCVVIGMGKSGHIGKKIAATLASTGTSAFFIHAAEALHGDLGMITAKDVVIMISNSGETTEITQLIAPLAQKKVAYISMTGQASSTLAQHAAVNLDISVDQEACPLGLAPTTSTTLTLVMGDAIAMSLSQAKHFTPMDFARSHPQGQLGQRLTLTVADLMTAHPNLPLVTPNTPLTEAILEMTAKHLGMTLVQEPTNGIIIGMITDGDLRRHWQEQSQWQSHQAKDIMTSEFKTTSPQTLAIDALNQMQQHKITHLVVLEPNSQQCAGILHIHHLFNSQITSS
jgi:arabinose-5-phosphate isomerase